MRRSDRRVLVITTLAGLSIGGLIYMLNKEELPVSCENTNNLDYYYSHGQWNSYDPDFFANNYIGELDKSSSLDEPDPTEELAMIPEEDGVPIFPVLRDYPRSTPPANSRYVPPVAPMPPVYPGYLPGGIIPPVGTIDKIPCGKVPVPGSVWLMLLGLFVIILITRRK